MKRFIASTYQGVPYVLVEFGLTTDKPIFVRQERIWKGRGAAPLVEVGENWRLQVLAFRERCETEGSVNLAVAELCANAYVLSETDARHACLIDGEG